MPVLEPANEWNMCDFDSLSKTFFLMFYKVYRLATKKFLFLFCEQLDATLQQLLPYPGKVLP